MIHKKICPILSAALAAVSVCGGISASAAAKTVTIGSANGIGYRVTDDNELWVWEGSATENQVKVMDGVSQVAVGESHIAAVSADGALYTLGDNEWGQLGDGTYISKTEPVKVSDNVKKVVCGDDFTIVLTTSGEVYGVGHHSGAYNVGSGEIVVNTQDLITSGAKDVFAAPKSVFVLYNDGTLYAAGDNGYGQLGCGGYLPQYKLIEVMSNVSKVSAEREYTLFLTNDGKVYGCGWNLYGQLGDKTDGTDTPQLLRSGVSDISATKYSALCLTESGILNAVGSENSGFAASSASQSTVVAGNVGTLFDGGGVLSNSGNAYIYSGELVAVGDGKPFVKECVTENGEIRGKLYSDEESAILLLCQYAADGRLLEISQKTECTETETEFYAELDADTAKVKVMVFENLTDIKPLMHCYTVDVSGEN